MSWGRLNGSLAALAAFTQQKGNQCVDLVDRGHLIQAHKEIRALASKYPQMRIVISCRTAAHHYLFAQFVDVELADFHQGQVRQFVRNWFCDQSEKADDCCSVVSESTDAATANRPNRTPSNSPNPNSANTARSRSAALRFFCPVRRAMISSFFKLCSHPTSSVTVTW